MLLIALRNKNVNSTVCIFLLNKFYFSVTENEVQRIIFGDFSAFYEVKQTISYI